jgi:hypothetical protein
VNREELYAIADQYGGCICDPAFSERGREDPQCRFHERRELMDDILAAGLIGPEPIKSYSHDVQELGYEGDG